MQEVEFVSVMQSKSSELAEALRQADQEYQFAFASGDPIRLTKAIMERRSANREYHAAKRQEFKSRNPRKRPSR